MTDESALLPLPALLAERAEKILADHPALRSAADDNFVGELKIVLACSEFAAALTRRRPELVSEMWHTGEFSAARPEMYWIEVEAALRDSMAGASLDEAKVLLRQLRQREMLRIAWRDLAGHASLDESLAELSGLADACIRVAVQRAIAEQTRRAGVPRDAAGNEVELVVLAMGKLGGGELNFSSDIDLIFLHTESGQTDGERVRDNADFFARVIRTVIDLLHDITADGFVFRVDTRLRPFGDSGPMSMNFSQAEQYYLTHGREWERYAWIKARAVVGSVAAVDELFSFITPFIYRRYLDYGVFSAIRDMKLLIEQEVRQRGEEHNLKLGRGGIREIEFIVQAMQLVRAGREPALQERRLQVALQELVTGDQISASTAEELSSAYIWLRRCENRLQAWADEQTHLIPDDPQRLAALAWAMRCADGVALHAMLQQVNNQVRRHFDNVFAAPLEDPASAGFVALWQNKQSSVIDYHELLQGKGFSQDGESARRLHTVRSGSHYRNLPENARIRLQQLLPQLIEQCAVLAEPDETLQRCLNVLEAIGGRTTYLTLLAENGSVIRILCKVCAASPWIARMLAQQPILLDELIDPRAIESPPSRDEISDELQRLLSEFEGDTEQEMEILRRVRHASMLRIAAADVLGHMRLMVVSDHLTELAEICVAASLQLARRDITARYGTPRCADGQEAEFAVIAFGKLGGIELGYGSDLDLVFLHNGADGSSDGKRCLDNQVWFTKLGQRLIHLLAQPTAAGSAYEVDMRLRPSGASGLLVSDISVYRSYQTDKAWLWEHQALVRARFVSGSAALGEQFAELRREILCQRREQQAVASEVLNMRRRMRDALLRKESGMFDLKQATGGVTDIEFLVQHLILSFAAEFPELIEFTDNIRQLEALQRVGVLDQALQVAEIYKTYRRRRHALDLQQRPVQVADSEFGPERALVIELWSEHVEGPAGE